MSTRERLLNILTLSMLLFLLGCVTTQKGIISEAALIVNDRSINLTTEKSYFNAHGMQIWLQYTQYNRPVENLIQKRRDSFLLYFRDDVDPYSNRSHNYSHCLADTSFPDRVLFYFGGEKTWNECLDKILPKKALRLWKICDNNLYELTVTPVTERDTVSLSCPAPASLPKKP